MGSSGSVRDSVAASSVDAVTCIESTGSIVGSTLVWNVCIGSVVAVVEEDVTFGILDEDATSEEDVVFLITDIVAGGRREEIVAGVSEVRS